MDEYQLENLVAAAFHGEANKKLIGKGKSRIAPGPIQGWNFHLCEWNLLSMFPVLTAQLMDSILLPRCIYKISSGPDEGIWNKPYFQPTAFRWQRSWTL